MLSCFIWVSEQSDDFCVQREREREGGDVVRGTSYTQAGRGGGQSVTFSEDFQASPARPCGKSIMKLK